VILFSIIGNDGSRKYARLKNCALDLSVSAPIRWHLTLTNIVTVKSRFGVTHFFDTEHLTNGYRYGHSYYIRPIGNRTQAFEWHQFQWHWVTSNAEFKITILFNVNKTRKWYKIELYLQWPTNRKSHMVYRTATGDEMAMTLNDWATVWWKN